MAENDGGCTRDWGRESWWLRAGEEEFARAVEGRGVGARGWESTWERQITQQIGKCEQDEGDGEAKRLGRLG
jgi:hypothetical protein